jgi:hypothetical protein
MATILRELRRRLARHPWRVAAALALPSLAQVLVVIPIAARPVGVLVALWSTAAGGLGDSRLLVR